MRATRAVRCAAAAAGWKPFPHRACDYPELAELKMWKSHASEVASPVLLLGRNDEIAAFAKVAQATSNPAGYAAIELPEPADSGEFFATQTDLLAKFIDVLYSPWVHVVCHSRGALTALQAARRVPERIGTLTVLDTPLLSEKLQRRHDVRRAVAAAHRDPNVPDALLAKLEAELEELAGAELLVSDDPLVATLAKGGAADDDYVAAVREVGQPMLVVVPSSDAQLAKKKLGSYYDTFNLKKVEEVQAKGRRGMMQGEAAAKLSATIDGFHQIYSTQHRVEQMWEAVRSTRVDKESKKGDDGGDGEGKKKKKKKK